MKRCLILVMAMALSAGLCGGAWAGTINLKLASFMAPNHVQHKQVIEPWAKKLSEMTGGKVKVTIFPASSLGKPPEHYDLAAKGIADIAFPILSYNPGRFNLTSVFELPFMFTTSEQVSVALWKVYEKYLQKEFKDVKVLWLFQHGPAQIFTTKKPVKTLADLNGMKIRCSNPFVNQSFTMLGATPVFMPVPSVYTALERGVIDGTAISYEGLVAFKQDDVVKYATTCTLYSLNMAIVMNKRKFDSLPPDVKKAIDETTGLAMCRKAGKAFDDAEIIDKKKAVAKGVQVLELPPAELAKWKEDSRKIWQQWAKDMNAKGLPGTAVLDMAKSLLGHK